MKHKTQNIDDILGSYQPDFSPFFDTRLKARLDAIKNDVKEIRLYDRFFKRVAFTGIAAIAAMLVLIFFINGSLSVDAILGVKELSLENSLMLSMADF